MAQLGRLAFSFPSTARLLCPLPLLPGVALVVHPGGALERLVRDASGLGVDPEEARAAVLSLMVTPNGPGPQPNPLAPSERVQPHVAGDHGHVEVVPPLRLDVHVAAEYLGLQVVGVLVVKPDLGVVAVAQAVGGHPVLLVSSTLGHYP